MDGKNILITGASDGIGRAMAYHFHSCGANLFLVARNLEKLQKIETDLGERVSVFPYDLAIVENVRSLFDVFKANGIKLDGAVHCAGLTLNSPIRTNDIEDMERLMRINFEALAEICKCFASKRYVNEGGAIVALSSTASLNPGKGLAIYSSSKAAVNALVKSASYELSARKIRVNAIAPAMVRTNMYYETIKQIPEIEQSVKYNQPYGLIEPEYIAYLAAYLLSDKAKYITGEIVTVSAGAVI